MLGVDASRNMIDAAVRDFGEDSSKAEFRVLNCKFLDSDSGVWGVAGDKVYVQSIYPYI